MTVFSDGDTLLVPSFFYLTAHQLTNPLIKGGNCFVRRRSTTTGWGLGVPCFLLLADSLYEFGNSGTSRVTLIGKWVITNHRPETGPKNTCLFECQAGRQIELN